MKVFTIIVKTVLSVSVVLVVSAFAAILLSRDKVSFLTLGIIMSFMGVLGALAIMHFQKGGVTRILKECIVTRDFRCSLFSPHGT